MTRTTVPLVRRVLRPLPVFVLVAAACASGGCAALTNPVADGIPVRRLPDEVLGRPRIDLRPLPLTMLRQSEPDQYRVDEGDVLGVYAEEVLGNRGQPIPIQVNPNPTASRPMVQGYPVPVMAKGKITLPELPPLDVKGKTLPEIRDLIAAAITGDPSVPGSKQIVVKGKERVLVDLIQPRRFRVLVVREDTSPQGFTGGPAAILGATRKGAGYSVYLEAYKNDLLEALNRTGGPPGLDAKNEVVIRRGQYDPADPTKGYVRIPLRARPEDPITFTEKDIILRDGDTVYIEARDTEVYYTAGLMGAAQIPLPRDYDLRVIQACAQIRGPLINGSFNQNAFVAQAVNTGVGFPSASLVTVVRQLPNQREIRIRVDLNQAFRDPRENILIQPGDIVVLQERPGEALTRYFTQTFRHTVTFIPVSNPRTIETAQSTNP